MNPGKALAALLGASDSDFKRAVTSHVRLPGSAHVDKSSTKRSSSSTVHALDSLCHHLRQPASTTRTIVSSCVNAFLDDSSCGKGKLRSRPAMLFWVFANELSGWKAVNSAFCEILSSSDRKLKLAVVLIVREILEAGLARFGWDPRKSSSSVGEKAETTSTGATTSASADHEDDARSLRSILQGVVTLIPTLMDVARKDGKVDEAKSRDGKTRVLPTRLTTGELRGLPMRLVCLDRP